MDSTGKNQDYQKKICKVESCNTKLLRHTASTLVFCIKLQLLKAKSSTRIYYVLSVLVASKSSPREEPPLRELVLKQKPKAKCAVLCYFIFEYLLHAQDIYCRTHWLLWSETLGKGISTNRNSVTITLIYCPWEERYPASCRYNEVQQQTCMWQAS